MLPWYVFLFVGAVDMGLYSYALISVQSAARVGAIYCSTSATACPDNTTACHYALAQLVDLPNVPSTITTCNASPVTVTVTYPASGPDGQPDVQVTVSYVLPALAGIPGHPAGSVHRQTHGRDETHKVDLPDEDVKMAPCYSNLF